MRSDNGLISIALSREELEFLAERCDRKCANLASLGLADADCYVIAERISRKIRKELKDHE